MGGPVPGDVPLCPICKTPSERVLTLSASALPFALTRDPSFFWYTCGCGALDFTAMQFREKGPRVFYSLAGGPSRVGWLSSTASGVTLARSPSCYTRVDGDDDGIPGFSTF